jgi:serine/threonine protein kinase
MPVKIQPVINSSTNNNTLHCIIYKSTLLNEFNNKECIDDLYKTAYYNNRKLNITGEMIINYSDASVVQILEGDQDVLVNLFNKIKNDKRHTNIVCLTSNNIEKRNYKKWCIKKTTPLNSKVDLTDYKMIGVIGTGSSGNVTLVESIINGRQYALKSMAKNKTKIETIMNERKILNYFKHTNFIVNLHSCFQDPLNVYFLIEYAAKGDMFSCLKQLGSFQPDLTQFYIVQIIQAISVLHNNNIIHRDLKLENILIDKDGYILLADFGLSIHKNRNSCKGLKGTPVYFAPELIKDSIIGFHNDIWALGILFHEFVMGENPYKFNTNNIVALENVIDTLKFELPNSDENNLLNYLLNKNYLERPKINDLFEHEYFANFDIDSVLNKNEIPPYLPNNVKINNWKIDSLSLT